jgi:hypothetical protein
VKPPICIYGSLSVLFIALFCGCGGSELTVALDKNQTAQLVKTLGTYEGNAHPKRIMGAMMTGVWTVTFLQDDSGVLKCRTSLRLHDSQNGWGSPRTETVGVRIWNGAGKGEYDLQADGQETQWMVPMKGVFATSGQPVNSLSLFDMDSYEITLKRM